MEKFTIKPLVWVQINETAFEATRPPHFYTKVWRESDSWRATYEAGHIVVASYSAIFYSAEAAKNAVESRYVEFLKETFLNPA